MLLNKLTESVKECINNDNDVLLIYYSGHGSKNNGGWIISLEDPSIEFDASLVAIYEVLDKIAGLNFAGKVEITSDSCYSG